MRCHFRIILKKGYNYFKKIIGQAKLRPQQHLLPTTPEK